MGRKVRIQNRKKHFFVQSEVRNVRNSFPKALVKIDLVLELSQIKITDSFNNNTP